MPIDAGDLAAHEGQRDSRAPISQSFDPVKDRKREVPATDLVHETVSPRGRAGGMDHNDPPPGMKVATDA